MCGRAITVVVADALTYRCGLTYRSQTARHDEDSKRGTRYADRDPRGLRGDAGSRQEHHFAFPAINCTSSETINAAIKGFADAGSDGIIQFSTGGAEFGSGLGIKDGDGCRRALAEFAT